MKKKRSIVVYVLGVAVILYLLSLWFGLGIYTIFAQDVPPYDDVFSLYDKAKGSGRRLTEQVGTRTFVRKIAIGYPDHEPGWRKVICLEEAQAIVNDFLEKNRDKFFDFPGPITEILLFKQALSFTDRSEYARRGTHFTLVYSQQYKGIPVFEASFRIRLTQYGEIITVMNGLALDLTNVPAEPKLTAQDALSCARKILGNENASSDSGITLFIFPPNRLAWHMNFPYPLHWEMMIDAVSGETVLQRRNVVK